MSLYFGRYVFLTVLIFRPGFSVTICTISSSCAAYHIRIDGLLVGRSSVARVLFDETSQVRASRDFCTIILISRYRHNEDI